MWWEFDSDESTWQVSTLEEEIVETKNYNLLKVKDIWLYILSIYIWQYCNKSSLGRRTYLPNANCWQESQDESTMF